MKTLGICKASCVFALTALFFLPTLSLSDPGGWIELPNTQLGAVCPPDGFNGATDPISGDIFPYDFSFFCISVTLAWSGATYDTSRNRLYIWGGGHMNYLGNEIYALDLNNTPTMLRLTDPATPLDYVTNPSELPPFDGTQPRSRETYDGLVYLPGPDKIWAWSGSLALLGFPDGVTWIFDPEDNTWERQFPSGDLPVENIGAVSAYDPNTGFVYLHNMMNLYRYEYNTSGGVFTQLTMFEAGFYVHMNGVIDPKRNKFILIGHGQNGNGESVMYDIGQGSNFAIETINAVGDTGFLGAEAPGLAYDPQLEKVVAWAGGDTLYVLDLDVSPPTWTAESFPVLSAQASEAPQVLQQGTYGRFEYASEMKGFVLYNATDKNAYLFRWPDTDDDGVIDKVDNCINIANADQRDTDEDGYGNICDPDFNNNGVVDPFDFSQLKSRFGDTDAELEDLNGNGVVDPFDFSLLKSLFGTAPGPSGLNP
ncbi:MAG: thrombospondin type 3 repeat-containing protein [Gammaproteobacteria bacterium]|nr:thrombospondin type 3 repeat-containing protein [Gammaproteobacteria bacterium]